MSDRFLSRRSFLKELGVATGAALAVGPRVMGANEEIRLAVIGCGVRGGTHIAEFGKLPGVRIVAVCDPDRVRLAAAAKTVATKFIWCGPARKEPIYRDKLQYDCSFTWNMGDGESCNQGVHEIDIARWMLGYTGLPRRTMSIGGRFVFNDAGEVPNTQIMQDIEVVPNTSTLGPWLQCDAARECIQDNAKANELVRGNYRQPFTVPEISL